MAKMSTNEDIKKRIENGEITCPETPQGVSRERITSVLKKLDKFSEDTRDAVFALLDESPNWHRTAPPESRFCDGACTAHIGAHIAILQRGADAKLDREGRDKWIKPLRDIGAIETCYLPAKNDKKLLKLGHKFYPGHLKAKSPNNAYRLSENFVDILRAPEDEWEDLLTKWIEEDTLRQRLKRQAELVNKVKELAYSSHTTLIQACCDYYIPHFLSDYSIVYIDDGDGDRITAEQQQKLKEAGLEITLGDAMPDILLWCRSKDSLWVVEAVTSDGEVDEHKMKNLLEFCKRYGKTSIGFTTAYMTWKKAAERQKQTKNNLAAGSYIWIMEDGSKQFKVEA